MNPEEENAFRILQAKLAQGDMNTSRMQQAVTLFSEREDENLIKWQLDIERSLLRIERLLRKQVPKRDERTGSVYYIDCPENELFNEYGINEVMNLLSWYVNKEIMLSVYDDKQVDLIMSQFADEVIDFIYTNLENFGLTNEDKKKHFPIITMNIINLVDATYRKAIGGKTLDNLKTARVVSQTEPLGKMPMYPSVNKKQWSWRKPSSWAA